MPIGVMAGVGLAVAVGGTVAEISAQKKAAKQAKAANKFQRQMSDLQSARDKIQALRQGRQSLAQAQQAAANQGVSGSSIGEGGAGSIFSQTMGNESFLSQYGYMADQASMHLQKSADYSARAGMFGAIAGLGSEVYSEAGGAAAFKGPPPPKKTG